MDVLLLYKDREVHASNGYAFKEDMCKDLNLELIFKTMSRGNEFNEKAVVNAKKEDPYLSVVAKEVMLIPLATEEEVTYRQGVLQEAISNPDFMKQLYEIATNANERLDKNKQSLKERRNTVTPSSGKMISQLELLDILEQSFGTLREFFRDNQKCLVTKEMKAFVERFLSTYSDEYYKKLSKAIFDLRFASMGGKLTLQANLGEGMKTTKLKIQDVTNMGYGDGKKSKTVDSAIKLYSKWFRPNMLVIKDEVIIRNAKELEESAVQYMLEYYQAFLKREVDFFHQLKYQLAFYVGCSNLYHRLSHWTIPLSMPKVLDKESKGTMNYEGLYELSMAILTRNRPVSNQLDTNKKWLVIITGANQGGKSTFLRSIGVAQVLFQCGMYVPAQKFESSLHSNIFTHFTRREDSAMNSGRLDEELKRMNKIMDLMTEDSMLLLNESFATTTEKEGSIIARDITQALYEKKILVIMVTHLFAFAQEMYEKQPEHGIFLSAERLEDGRRTFRILAAEPTLTSYGLDLYNQLIGQISEAEAGIC